MLPVAAALAAAVPRTASVQVRVAHSPSDRAGVAALRRAGDRLAPDKAAPDKAAPDEAGADEAAADEAAGLAGDDLAPRAVHLLAAANGVPVATMRIVTAAPGEALPLDDAFDLRRVPDRAAAELSPLVTRPGSGADPALVLGVLRLAYDEARRAGAEQLYLGADQPLLSMLRGRGFRFRALAGPAWVSGAWTIMAALPVVDLLPGLRLHQAVHGCAVADYFADAFTGAVPGAEVCARRAG